MDNRCHGRKIPGGPTVLLLSGQRPPLRRLVKTGFSGVSTVRLALFLRFFGDFGGSEYELLAWVAGAEDT
jgi:hypothetical protein